MLRRYGMRFRFGHPPLLMMGGGAIAILLVLLLGVTAAGDTPFPAVGEKRQEQRDAAQETHFFNGVRIVAEQLAEQPQEVLYQLKVGGEVQNGQAHGQCVERFHLPAILGN